MSENNPVPLLREWCESAHPIQVRFQAGSSNSGWQRKGQISHVGLAEFEISWDDGGSQTFKYDVLTTIDGRQLRFIYSTGDVVVVHEVSS